MFKPCWRPCVVDDSTDGRFDGLLWSKDLGSHVYGQFSMAVVQANFCLEDRGQLESGSLSTIDSGPQGTFVGVYDGHAGDEASRFITNNLFPNLRRIMSKGQELSENVIKKAFEATEDGFLSLVRKQWLVKPHMASVGSCCLVGVLCNGLLYTANAGDSRAVLGTLVKGSGQVTAVQMSMEHNANIGSVRDELSSLHPDDPEIVVLKHKVWRVKGLIQVSRSIGDAYLKRAEFNREPLHSKYRLPETFHKPILSPEPAILVHRLRPEDQFIIFASDGLWEHLSNEEAVSIVQNYPRHASAKRLVKAALMEAAKKREIRYSDLKKIGRGVRRHFHDDITVVVLFIDSHLFNGVPHTNCSISVKAGVSSAAEQ
ncbi:hypothetical protein K2173_019625 [Erythroxylum novogranatense]|uniref:protein-serine/threonine phosphatase n=1 Tax=Erythroxylum novogranatense TaxID=1862640 RepID=A0AAV8UGI6_9ROSI|nr:hypothetical protein K2173_019625 [Erythroxylum novogranatense]